LQVLDAERDLFNAELDLSRLQRDERVTIVGLYKPLAVDGNLSPTLRMSVPGVPRWSHP